MVDQGATKNLNWRENELIVLEKIVKEYKFGKGGFRALDEVSLKIRRGDLVSIVGQSGSGKTTLLNIIGGLDRQSQGTYWLGGQDTTKFDDVRWSAVRNRTFGFVFQAFHLVPTINALENIALPLIYRGIPLRQRRHQALNLLRALNMERLAHSRPSELSGGEQQRVAIARALITEPFIVLADEPTGNLDTKSASMVLEMLLQINQQGKTVIIVTHDPGIAAMCRVQVRLADGHIVEVLER